MGQYAYIILLVALITFSLGIPFVMKRRSGQKMGCLAYGYVALIVFMISSFTIGLSAFLTKSFISDTKAIVSGHRYDAVIYKYRISGTNDDGNDMHMAYYSLVDKQGDTIKIESRYSTGDVPIIGDTVPMYYNVDDRSYVELGASFYIMTIGAIIMWMALAVVFSGIVWYALALDMSKFFKHLGKILFSVFIPLIMVSFEALLIYAFFYGNEVPWFVKAILAFFILILGLVIVGGIQAKIKEWMGIDKKKEKNKRKKKSRN